MDKAGSKRRTGRGRSGSPRTGPVRSHFVFTIPSVFAASRDVQEKILSDIERRGFNEQTRFAIKLALEEALINAIKHGNRFDPRKEVHVEATITPEEALIIVEDEGPGFDRSSVPDPTLRENVEKCSGRGILLIEAYMNQVQWTNGGRCLRMIKRNEPDVIPGC
jgi:serine/threonine-protein kinase RsbW